jgi:ketosteroid isomerase-like protein
MSEENVEIVRGILDAYLAGDFQTALGRIDPEVEFDLSMRPDGKVYRGHDGIVEGLRTWTGTWEDYSLEITELIDAGEHVIAVDRQSGRGKGSGMLLEHSFSNVYTLRDGKVIRVAVFANREDALRAAGVSE